MPPASAKRSASMRAVVTNDDRLSAAAIFAEAAMIDDELANISSGKTVHPVEIAEDGSVASYELFEGTSWSPQLHVAPIRKLLVSRPPSYAKPDGSLYPVKGEYGMDPTILVPTTTAPQPLTSGVVLVVPSSANSTGQAVPTENAIIMTTTGLA